MIDFVLAAVVTLLIVGTLSVWVGVIRRQRAGVEVVPGVAAEPAPWGGGQLAWGLPVVYVAPSFVYSFMRRQHLGEVVPPELGVQDISIIGWGMLLQLAILLGIGISTPGVQRRDFGLRPVERHDVWLGIQGFLASLLPVVSLNLLVEQAGWREPQGEHLLFRLLRKQPGLAGILGITLIVIVLAPLVEELMYRVLLQGWLMTRLTRRGAILFSSAAFAIVHAGPGKPDWIPIFALALILGYLYERRRSYLTIVLTHACFNGCNLLLFWLSQEAGIKI